MSVVETAVRTHIGDLRRLPELLKAHPAESHAVQRLLATVEGQDTSEFPECGILWKCGQAFLASAIFIGGRWALTVGHNTNRAGEFHVTFPAAVVGDLRPANSFRVAEVIRHLTADLSLLHIASDGLSPDVTPAVFATAAEFTAAGHVKVCGFGSGDCTNPGVVGTKRISDLLEVVTSKIVAALPVDPATEFAADNAVQRAVTCDSDSGGPAFVFVRGVPKTAGAIIGTITDPASGKVFTKCLRLLAFLPWIREKTGLTL
jgi:Trypsin